MADENHGWAAYKCASRIQSLVKSSLLVLISLTHTFCEMIELRPLCFFILPCFRSENTTNHFPQGGGNI